MLKTTPFTDIHIALGARMAEFAGFNMPIQYPTGIQEEHRIVREGVGVFDVSHMGEFWVKGTKAVDFLQYITTNDINRLDAGKAQYSCFPNGKGGIVDDLIVYKYSTTKYLLVVNAGNIDKEFLLKQKAEGLTRKLVHFECLERAIPRNGYEICDEAGNTIGNVTSGIMLPTTKVGIGMGYVKIDFAKKDTIIYIKIREKLNAAKIV